MRFSATLVTSTQVTRTAVLGTGRVVDSVVVRMGGVDSRTLLLSAEPAQRECYRATWQQRANLHADNRGLHLPGPISGKPAGTSGGWRGLIAAAPTARSRSARIS